MPSDLHLNKETNSWQEEPTKDYLLQSIKSVKEASKLKETLKNGQAKLEIDSNPRRGHKPIVLKSGVKNSTKNGNPNVKTNE